MQQAPFDLRDFVLGELDREQEAAVERYLQHSAEAREEVARLRVTMSALQSLPDEEPPRRIAFVSDKVFEPSPWTRFWRSVWAEGPRMAFGMAAMLAVLFAGAAITQPRVGFADGEFELAFGPEPASAPVPVATPEPSLDAAQVEAIVAQAVTAAVAKDREQTLQAVADRLESSRVEWQTALTAYQQDVETGYHLLDAKYDKLIKEATQAQFASLQ